ncbi:MAG: hypothetical protein HeimC3_31200 [Candidatus Heimdallarchaeota archaeon LC_3]|nr:MAG: hypothetical protein HeimC3_31200 [Candidatus Heimdallarchaeota archaeon LC_3]
MLKIKRIFFISTILIFLFNSSIISSGNAISLSEEPFRPVDGNFSTYTWNFTGFAEIASINTEGDFVDYTNVNEKDFIWIENPIEGVLNVSIHSYMSYLMENVSSIISNETTSIFANGLYLINITTREYVNTQGLGSANYANSYIDPRGLTLGDKVWVSSSELNLTSIESITIVNVPREAYKLILDLDSVKITCYYDSETGILLKFSIIHTISSEVSNRLKITTTKEESRELLSTNAFNVSTLVKSTNESNPVTSSGYAFLITIFSLLVIKKVKKYKKC